MDAAYHGDAGRVRTLLRDGADPNVLSTTPHRHRPLHRAIEHKKTRPHTAGHEQVVHMLLKHGADPHLRATFDQHTALQLAAIDAPRFVPLLIDHFKPLDIFHACAVADGPRVKALLAKDATLATARDVNGYTPLHYVAASRMYQVGDQHLRSQLAIAQRLIDAGADVNASYVYGGVSEWPIPVLYFACGRNDNPDLTELLLQRGAIPYDNESVYHASDEGHAACLAVIEKYADRRKLKAEATKCLATQMHWGNTRGARWLLEHGADPNTLRPETGLSALHAAARNGASEKVIQLLLDHGADPRRKSRDGHDAITTARQANKNRVLKQLQTAIGR